MEPQAEYKVKERQFHGDYFSPRQGKRPDQYSASAIIFFCSCALITIIIFIAGLIKIAGWLTLLIKSL
jgi:hypothetical protein